jgi:hypothetical protein
MAMVADAGSSPALETMADGRRPSLAVVDDDSGFAGYFRTFLALRGYEARSYARGEEILAALKHRDLRTSCSSTSPCLAWTACRPSKH